jgi:glutamate racemase
MRLGVFDSGLGGLTVVRRLRERLPQADILFFADQLHLPYGERDPEELYNLLRINLATLEAQGVEAIVMGCNTSCGIAAQFGMPRLSVPVFDLIEAGANAAFAVCVNRFGVIATPATVSGGAYRRALMVRDGASEVIEIASPALVPLIERNAPESKLLAAVREIADCVKDCQAIILGCSHYPLIEKFFIQALPLAAIIDPAVEQSLVVANWARRQGREREGVGRFQAWSNGDLEAFFRRVAQVGITQEPSLLAGAS